MSSPYRFQLLSLITLWLLTIGIPLKAAVATIVRSAGSLWLQSRWMFLIQICSSTAPGVSLLGLRMIMSSALATNGITGSHRILQPLVQGRYQLYPLLTEMMQMRQNGSLRHNRFTFLNPVSVICEQHKLSISFNSTEHLKHLSFQAAFGNTSHVLSAAMINFLKHRNTISGD
jgi:hypothetical protein